MRRRSGTFLLLGVLACVTHADDASMPQAPASPAVATVNGEELSLVDLERYLGRVHDQADAVRRADFDLDRLMFRLVNDTLLGQEARALGLDREGSIPGQVEAYRQRLATAELERVEIAERARPTDDEVRRAFEQQYPEITLQVVTAYQRQGAEELLAELEAGEVVPEARPGDHMTVLARERSVDPYAGRGGRVESVAAIDLQREVAELAKSLAPGELGGPVRTDLGWSVIRLVALEPADPERFPGVENSLRRLVRHRKSQALRAALARTARERRPVTVERQLADSVEAVRLPDARLMPRFADPKGIVARIGTGAESSEPLQITAEDYRKALLKRWSGVRNAEAALAAAPGVLEQMIEARVLLAEALARGYGARAGTLSAARAFETSLLVPRYLEEVVAPGVEVSREEMEAHYRQHRAEFTRPPRVHLGQITVAGEEEAQRIAGLLRQGTDLGWLARRHSIDRFRDQGGERGWVEAGSSGFDPRLLDAEPGDVLDPVGSSGNVVVLKVTARQEGEPYSFEEVSGNVRSAVFSRKMRAAIEQLMDTLRERSEIEIDRELLAGMRLGGTLEEAAETAGGHGH